ncbi:DsbA family protein [Kocuria sp. TGY1127_2]|uniref:mycothiol-dependent nitroreductase Rv2466c family protein n=1 Tax=Kocuria sp. TGY1127_2 TaxID=2711328 RepID=UPI0015B88E76|nr:DsbA family protein [Kocuria sp. TGY1127_2]
MTQNTEFWFDPICPWAWMTSRWMSEVEELRDVEVTWNPFSLAVLNEGKDLDAGYRKNIDASWGPARVAMAVREEQGQEKVKPFYDAVGTALHPEKTDESDNRRRFRAAIDKALEETGLPPELADYAEKDTYDEELRRSNARALELVGDDVGVPIISVDGTAFFGPVMSPAPKGEDAAKVWDGTLALASYPGFFELKRSRTNGPIFD